MLDTVGYRLAQGESHSANVESNVEDKAQQFFVGMVAQPRQKNATLGVIVIGLGIADMLAVRQFARLGMVAMQIRLIKDAAHHNDTDRRYATYDAAGVDRCRSAMDFLAAKHKVERFVLMGNCALANIAFNTALVDARVAGLVLTNPYVPESLCSGLFMKIQQHWFRRSSWIRLLTGRMKFPDLATRLPAGADAESGSQPVQSPLNKDASLPPDFDHQLGRLMMERGLRALLVFSKSEPGLYYFRKVYGKTLRKLVRVGSLRLETVTTEVHDFSHCDDAAANLNKLLHDWTEKTWTDLVATPQ